MCKFQNQQDHDGYLNESKRKYNNNDEMKIKILYNYKC